MRWGVRAGAVGAGRHAGAAKKGAAKARFIGISGARGQLLDGIGAGRQQRLGRLEANPIDEIARRLAGRRLQPPVQRAWRDHQGAREVVRGETFLSDAFDDLFGVSKGYSLAYLIVSIGPFMIIPNVGLNEWGHTFWFMEELFVAPLHWGFVFFGWMALAVFGVTLQLLARVRALIGAEGVALLT